MLHNPVICCNDPRSHAVLQTFIHSDALKHIARLNKHSPTRAHGVHVYLVQLIPQRGPYVFIQHLHDSLCNIVVNGCGGGQMPHL